MPDHKKSLIVLEALLVIFVAMIVYRWFSLNQAIKSNNEYLAGAPDQSAEQNLTAPVLLTSDPARGYNQAETVVVTFEDFTCAYCAQMSNTLSELVNRYPKKIRVVWKDFVGNLEQTGLRSAVAARCAQSQGKFWEYHDFLFANQTSLSDAFYKQIAGDLGLDEARFNSCFDNQETLPLVQQSFNEGLALGVDATPYVFINAERFSGLVSYEQLEQLIQ
ncbi:TPA: hypothetical protein DCL28_04275 [Candidatus Komeilibacteria bacterium]|nr:MAG: DSBA oxidoreductase [Parcubacteria group bacterium GW2011_GWF2_45_11]OGY95048.1 MAG: hypothetical protein A3J95_04480 [Candidatus Komeilibacteria bacterium RIFOXYC2_FULL_45_12]HAH04739.1 hypothetical protein [Candidatus Komeilibacteria bacterium]HCC73466.1 hypothetical protein [Candidatus Komeilibacteria bacterium]